MNIHRKHTWQASKRSNVSIKWNQSGSIRIWSKMAAIVFSLVCLLLKACSLATSREFWRRFALCQRFDLVKRSSLSIVCSLLLFILHHTNPCQETQFHHCWPLELEEEMPAARSCALSATHFNMFIRIWTIKLLVCISLCPHHCQCRRFKHFMQIYHGPWIRNKRKRDLETEASHSCTFSCKLWAELEFLVHLAVVGNSDQTAALSCRRAASSEEQGRLRW